MKNELILKSLIVGMLLISLPILFLNKDKLVKNVFSEEKKTINTVNSIINNNADKELITNKNYNQFIYLAFQNENKKNSYFIDTKTGEVKDFEFFIKEDKKEAFQEKIKELLDLKYPKFIAEKLKESQNKTYLLENDLIINYENDLTLPIEENLFLTVNYQEIQECMEYNFYASDSKREEGYNYKKDKKTIAFTFDDGPSGNYTNELVEILKENKAHATFFMVGNRMETGASVMQNVLKNGNEIGSHSYAHKNMARQKINDIIEGEEKTKETYRRITNQEMIYTRPPYGNINKEIKESLDTIFINWNVDTEDWLHRNKDHIVNHILENAKDGDIILMHDCYETTVEAVREVLPLLYARGFQVVSVSELASLKDKTLEKHSLYRSITAD